MKVRAGECIRVWRRYPAVTPPHGEWAEVIRSGHAPDGEHQLLCETLQFEAFSFSPQQVAGCCDHKVVRYQAVCEEYERHELRQREVARLHQTLNEKGRLCPWAGDVPSYMGFTTASSQLRIKATVLELVGGDSIGVASKRQALQEELERIFEVSVAQLTQQMRSHQGKLPPDNGLAAWLPVCSHQLKREAAPKKHYPELCAECISSGTWCSESLHLPCVTLCLDAVAEQLSPGICWRRSEAGLEAEISYGDAKVMLLQIRPRLFCIPDVDAALFGSQGEM
mmetsp:Transcript_43483/g.78048  ORF Transcript_43483/g.78048 Transcript_43483/m.78048 type:complete len:281 (+) Transcript_43483:2-844(+)